MPELAPQEHDSITERERDEREHLGEDEPTQNEASAEATAEGTVEDALDTVFRSVRFAQRLGISREDILRAALEGYNE